MAIKMVDKTLTNLQEAREKAHGPNAMVVEVIRSGTLWYFDGNKVVLLASEEPSVLKNPHNLVDTGKTMYDFEEIEEFKQILAGDGDRYMLETVTETIRVVARFSV